MYTSSITVDQVIDALADVIQPFVDGAQIVRAQANRVSMPDEPCVVLTELLEVDLSVPAQSYDPINDLAIVVGPTRIDVQIDFYSPLAGDFCKSIKSVLRSPWGFEQFPVYVKPLYTSDGIQAPLITGEQQYESRWTLTVSLQYNPTVSVPQEFADVATPNELIPADLL